MPKIKILIKSLNDESVFNHKIFLSEQAMISGIERLFCKYINKDIIEVRVDAEKSQINLFYENIIKRSSKYKIIKREPYEGSIPSIDRYHQHLFLEGISFWTQ